MQVVDVMQLLEDGEDGTAGSCDDVVLQCDLLHFGHDALGIAHLGRDLTRFRLERFQRLDDVVVIKNIAAGLVE